LFNLSAEKFRSWMLRMEKHEKNIAALAMVVNSGGGSAVYSNIIANSLRSFCSRNKIKLYTFAEDIAASGGYWILCCGDEVYGYQSSKIGSVGVVMTGFDFKQFLDNRNIERNYFTSKNNDEK
jgi:ClpP class serine protease